MSVDAKPGDTVPIGLTKRLGELAERIESLEQRVDEDKLVIGVMSGNFDTTMAAFIIALGAAASDMEVDMFFTFWATTADPAIAAWFSPAPIDRMGPSA
jgi:hypothetical protein